MPVRFMYGQPGAGAPAALNNVIVVVDESVGYEPTFQGALEEATGVDLRTVFGTAAAEPTGDAGESPANVEIDPADADTVRRVLEDIESLEVDKAAALAEDPIDWGAFADAQTEIDSRLAELAAAFDVGESGAVEPTVTTTTVP